MMPGLKPLPGFDWMRVSWGGPDEPASTACSYGDAPIRAGDVPLCMAGDVPLCMWNAEGWMARFCAACMQKHWGFAPRDGVGK